MTKGQTTKFQDTVWNFYYYNGRHDLPWRQKSHLRPYNVLVSEMMLQQTQVARVIPKYKNFLQQWGSARALARAPLGEVLVSWQGLGYNRRAKFLHEACTGVVQERSGIFPKTVTELQTLPGVGDYTAGAVCVFAYNQPAVLIETNIRTVYLHHFFKEQQHVPDNDIRALVVSTLDQACPREWYWALMDYGSYLKREHTNPSRNSKHYTKQSVFKGSDREIRGAIIRALAASSYTEAMLLQSLQTFAADRISIQLQVLVEEGLVVKYKRTYQLP